MISQSTLSPTFHQFYPFIRFVPNHNKPTISHSPIISLHNPRLSYQILGKEVSARMPSLSKRNEDLRLMEDIPNARRPIILPSIYGGAISWLAYTQAGVASEGAKIEAIYETGELFELGIQLSYLLLLLGLLGVGTFYVIRQVLVRRELDLSAKELQVFSKMFGKLQPLRKLLFVFTFLSPLVILLWAPLLVTIVAQEQVRSGDGSGTELFELGAVMLRRKFYPAATKYLLQAIEKWDGDDQDLAQVHNALGVSYVRDDKLEKGIAQFETAVKIQPGYVTAWNNLGDAYEKNKDMNAALRAFEEALLFDPNNKIASPRRDALKEKVQMYKGVSVKTKPQPRQR